MRDKQKKLTLQLDGKVLWSLGAAILLTAVAVALFDPAVVTFRAFDVIEFVQSLLPLVMFALFIERVLEVFITSWRAHQTADLKECAATARLKRSSASNQLGSFQTTTDRLFSVQRSQTSPLALQG